MLTADELAAMRTTAGDALPGTAVVQVSTWVSDGGGGGSQSWAPSGTVDCRLAPLTGSERDIADRIASDAEFIVTLPAQTAIDVDDRVQIDGATYNVSAIRDRSWELTTRVEVTKEV